MNYTIPPTAIPSDFEALLDASESCMVMMVNYGECFAPDPSDLDGGSFMLDGLYFSQFNTKSVKVDYVAGVSLIFYVESHEDEITVLQPLVPLTEF